VSAGAQGECKPAGDLADVVASTKPAVVSITAKYLDRADAAHVGTDDPQVPSRRVVVLTTSQGAGFFVSADGYIVTNQHVVETSRSAEIMMADGMSYKAKVIASDPRSDLALLKIDGQNDFPFVKFAERPAREGQRVFAVGNPFGFEGSVTAGIVSALDRHVDVDGGSNDDLIQIDAALNIGNSGGPTFDLDGNVVGVNTLIYSPSGGSVGLGFAVPAQTVSRVITQLKTVHAVQRGWFGVQSQAVTPAIAEALGLGKAWGALVAEASGPAAEVGIVPGDVISSMNGERIKDNFDLTRRIDMLPPGTTVHVGLVHEGAVTTIAVELGETPPSIQPETAMAIDLPASNSALNLGLTLAPISAFASADAGEKNGLLVLAIEPDRLGADLGIDPGDIILDVGGRPMQTPDEFQDALQDAHAAGRPSTLMRVRSGDTIRFVVVPFDAA
jgi:serine protease Do